MKNFKTDHAVDGIEKKIQGNFNKVWLIFVGGLAFWIFYTHGVPCLPKKSLTRSNDLGPLLYNSGTKNTCKFWTDVMWYEVWDNCINSPQNDIENYINAIPYMEVHRIANFWNFWQLSTVYFPGSLGYLPRCSDHRATPARPQVADSGMTFN